VSEFDVLKAGGAEERFDVWLLAESEFEGEIAARDERGVRGGEEEAINFESVAAAEESDVRFVLADFYGDKGTVSVRNVGRVGDDNFEVLARDRGE
jgi:hypothetical protein